MEVIKVIVDSLPKSCDDCPFPFGGSGRPGWQCSIMEISSEKGHWDIDDHIRPDWCPLIEEGEVFDWLMRRPPTPVECGKDWLNSEPPTGT